MEKKACSTEMDQYFMYLDSSISKAYETAYQARRLGLDPEDFVPIPLSSDMAERVEGLISVVIPQIVGKGLSNRIKELEEEFSSLDWRVALTIALEVANRKFCNFKDDKEAWETGIRVGLAYLTMGTVSSPIEGFLELKIKKRRDGSSYWAVCFGGPIRSAGGTMAAVTLVIADFLRIKMGFLPYDPTEDEINRNVSELYDYHERVTNLQYLPSEEEIKFLTANIPVQIDGDPSEKFEVSNFKDLPRVETNLIRNGVCLVLGEGIAQKATKVWSMLSQWGESFGLGHWSFLVQFLELQKGIKAKSKKQEVKGSEAPKLLPDFTYIKDLVAGRPVFTHPLRMGGFRLRYGRCRTSGFSAYAIHPATMVVLNQYLATGTQLKLERPGKATSLTSCDSIEGPIVRLENGEVLLISSMEDAKRLTSSITEILFLGDILINYGDFANRKHMLIPSGYCEEWWALELEEAVLEKCDGDTVKAAEHAGVELDRFCSFLKEPLMYKPQFDESYRLSMVFGVPLAPTFVYHWKSASAKEVVDLHTWLSKAQWYRNDHRITKLVAHQTGAKRVLELIGTPHQLVNGFVIVEGDHAAALALSLGLDQNPGVVSPNSGVMSPTPPLHIDPNAKDGLDMVSNICPLTLRDKSGTFIGARMGRPEKAKIRELTGSPQVLFPVGEEGGRLRCFQSAMKTGIVKADFPLKYCPTCKKKTVYQVCEVCSTTSKQMFMCRFCETESAAPVCSVHGKNQTFANQEVDIQHYLDVALKKLGMPVFPDLIKGVRGTSNKDHIPEQLAKGILRSHHELAVNKDGTVRYDMTQLPITHFTPEEVGTHIEVLKKFGYMLDIHGKELIGPDQVLELKPQDIILPHLEPPMEGADKILFRTAGFVDDLLERFYSLPRFYNLSSPADLVGHMVLCLAPHTSAGLAARIIGFSRTQGFFAHPLVHAAQRRDCDGDESSVTLLLDALLNFSRKYLPSSRGSTQDAPLVLTSRLVPSEVDDMAFDVDTVWKYPLELYKAALLWKMPSEVKIEQIKHRLGKPSQYEGMGFTHPVSNINYTVPCSAYKTLPTMDEKLAGQMDIAKKVRAVDKDDVARLVIEKHFLKDTKGNLRKFSMQQFRCVSCNEKFRRVPLIGRCLKCKGRIIFTISEGSVVKYLAPTIMLSKKYGVPKYLSQTIELLQRRFFDVFGKEKEKQTGLGVFFGATQKIADSQSEPTRAISGEEEACGSDNSSISEEEHDDSSSESDSGDSLEPMMQV